MITSSTQSFDECVDSLTGFEEVEIAKWFKGDITELLETRATIAGRALVFVVNLRHLKNSDVKTPEAKAYEHVMGMTLKQVGEFFPGEVDEVMPEEPVTEVGKDASTPV